MGVYHMRGLWRQIKNIRLSSPLLNNVVEEDLTQDNQTKKFEEEPATAEHLIVTNPNNSAKNWTAWKIQTFFESLFSLPLSLLQRNFNININSISARIVAN